MPKKRKEKKEWTPHSYLVADARKRWRYSPSRTQALNRAKVEKGKYKCSLCAAIVGYISYITKKGRKANKLDGTVDHIVAVGKQPREWDEYPAYYRRMFCETSNLQFICSACTAVKNAQDRAERKALKEKQANA